MSSKRWTSGQTPSRTASRHDYSGSSSKNKSRAADRRTSPKKTSDSTQRRSPSKKSSQPPEPSWWDPRSPIAAIAAVGLLVLLGAAAAYAISARSAEMWEARAELEYRGRSFVETAAISAASRTEIADVAEQFDLPVDDVEERFTVVQAPNTEILALIYQDEDRDRSLALLGEMTNTIVARGEDSGVASQILLVQQELERVQESLDLRRTAIEGLDEDAPTTPGVTADIEQIGVLSRQIADLELRLVDLELREIEEAPIVVTAPYLLSDPVGPKPVRRAMLGAVAGLGFAVASLVVIAKRR